MLKEKFVLDTKWIKTHLREIKKKAGVRYTPELNVGLPILDIFDGISRTEKFYVTIREEYGELLRAFRYVTYKYENKNLQKKYDQIKKDINSLFKDLENIKGYDSDSISWDKIQQKTKGLDDKFWKFIDQLINEREQVKNIKTPPKPGGSYQQSPSEKIDSDIHHIHKIREIVHNLEIFSSSLKAQLSNRPFLFLTGEAGSGKTHLLCDVVEHRINNEKEVLPALLIFGEFFSNDKDFWSQALKQLGIEDTIKTKENFLKTIDDLGKKRKCRSLLIIDALNENINHAPDFWKKNLNTVVKDVEKYSNIALIMSVRSGFENEVLTEEQKKFFIHKEHQGFRFKEWEAVNKFFNAFSIPLPEIPLLVPEFQNPLFLLLFCKAFKRRKPKKKKQIFRGIEGATYIFESFILNATNVIAKEFKIQKGSYKSSAYRIWNEIIKEIASEMVHQNNERIPEEKLVDIIQKTYPHVDAGKFVQALEGNMLVVKVPKYMKDNGTDSFDVRFPFQKFSDHLIGRYIFKKYEDEFGNSNKNLKTAKKYFSKRRKLGKFLSNTRRRGIIEALSIQCPEQLKGIEFIEVAPYLLTEEYLAQITEEAFVESLIWRNPKAFSKNEKNTLRIINETIVQKESGQIHLLNAFLSVAPILNHPFNAERLFKHLSNFSMPKRDSWWSTFLHYQYGNQGAVDRLLQWCWSETEKNHINDESAFLASITLSWFLTTPNRAVRDKATKGLVCLLQHRINLLPKLLEKFKDTNDLYVVERLFAVAYGCVLRNQEDLHNLKILAIWIYENIFKDNRPPVHILLRDYARGVIEVALRRGIGLKINKSNVDPPYISKWPKKMPSDKKIKNYEFDYKSKNFKDYYWAQNNIINSMQPEHSRIGMYGDFGRYVFQSALSCWNIEKKGYAMQQISNLAVQEIFKLGYDVELHGEFDRALNRYNTGRSGHKSERIGKKYQWIAFHQIAALVSDHFEFKGDSWSDSREDYKGPWHLNIRDIDPSFVLQNDEHIKNSITFSSWQSKYGHYDAWENAKSTEDWIKTGTDLPKPQGIIQIDDDKNNGWLMLEGFVKWEEKTPPKYKKYDIPIRELWYIIRSYIVKKRDAKNFFDWAKKQDFTGSWMPESHNFYEIFLGEYPNSTAFNDLRGDYNIWTKSGMGAEDIKIPVVVTDDSYLNESTLDCSYDGNVSVKLPCKWLVNNVGLNHLYLDGRFFDSEGNLMILATSVFEEKFPSTLLINKQALINFLDKNEYSIFWTISGEKQLIGGNSPRKDFVGRLELSGVYTLNNGGNVSGKSHVKYKD